MMSGGEGLQGLGKTYLNMQVSYNTSWSIGYTREMSAERKGERGTAQIHAVYNVQ